MDAAIPTSLQGFHSGPTALDPKEIGVPRILLPGTHRPEFSRSHNSFAVRIVTFLALWGIAVAAFVVMAR